MIRWTLMIRCMLLLIGGTFLGGLVHLVTIIVLPRTATRDAYSRLEKITKINTILPLPAPIDQRTIMPFTDPAFVSAVCSYDLSQGPMKLTVPVGSAYTSVSFYTRYNVAYYAINDQAAGRRAIELNLMTHEQHSQLPEEEDMTSADRLIVDSPTIKGLIVIRALAPERSVMEEAKMAVARAKCGHADLIKARN